MEILDLDLDLMCVRFYAWGNIFQVVLLLLPKVLAAVEVTTTSLVTHADFQSKYCGSTTNHRGFCSSKYLSGSGCDKMAKRATTATLSPGDFDTLLKKTDCTGDFILDRTGFNLTIVGEKAVKTTFCETGFDPSITWDSCFNQTASSCSHSLEVCDADRPEENCFANKLNGMSSSGMTRIYTTFLNGQLACKRCLLLITDTQGTASFCLPLVIAELTIKDQPEASLTTAKTDGNITVKTTTRGPSSTAGADVTDSAPEKTKTNTGNNNSNVGPLSIVLVILLFCFE